jgi:ribosomal-protein-serine acetyltransferase
MFSYRVDDEIELRILQTHDVREFFAFVQNNRAHLNEWLLWPLHIHSEEDARAFLQEGMDDFARDGLPVIGIYARGELAGGFAFFPLDRRINAAEFGYWLGKEFVGRGIMSRALDAVLKYLYATIGVHRVQLRMEIDNTASRALAERAGFTFEGIARQGWKRDDALRDVAIYSLLASEWKDKNESHRE